MRNALKVAPPPPRFSVTLQAPGNVFAEWRGGLATRQSGLKCWRLARGEAGTEHKTHKDKPTVAELSALMMLFGCICLTRVKRLEEGMKRS